VVAEVLIVFSIKFSKIVVANYNRNGVHHDVLKTSCDSQGTSFVFRGAVAFKISNNVLGSCLCLGIMNVNSDRLAQDYGDRNIHCIIGALQQWCQIILVPGVIYSGPIFTGISRPGNAIGTIGGHEAKVTASLDELRNLKIKI
jgi:hypothetical protein